jgi:two-component system response regulator PhoP
VSDGQAALHFALEYPIDLAIIALGLPRLSGLDVVRRVRAAGRHLPILMLAAGEHWRKKVQGLDAGADDYLTKPFAMMELLARVRALARRAGGWAQPVLECGPIKLDPASHEVTVVSRSVTLTTQEYKVLHNLMLRAGEIVSKAALIDHLYEGDTEPDSNVIEVLIRRLRTKLDPQDTLKPIKTLRGSGYRLTAPRKSRV